MLKVDSSYVLVLDPLPTSLINSILIDKFEKIIIIIISLSSTISQINHNSDLPNHVMECELDSLYSAGYDDERSLLMSQKSLEKRFGQSPVFIAATFMEQGGIPPTTNPATLLKEAIHVISCGYEDKTEWGKEVS